MPFGEEFGAEIVKPYVSTPQTSAFINFNETSKVQEHIAALESWLSIGDEMKQKYLDIPICGNYDFNMIYEER